MPVHNRLALFDGFLPPVNDDVIKSLVKQIRIKDLDMPTGSDGVRDQNKHM